MCVFPVAVLFFLPKLAFLGGPVIFFGAAIFLGKSIKSRKMRGLRKNDRSPREMLGWPKGTTTAGKTRRSAGTVFTSAGKAPHGIKICLLSRRNMTLKPQKGVFQVSFLCGVGRGLWQTGKTSCHVAFSVPPRRFMPYKRTRRILTPGNNSLISLKRFQDTFAFSCNHIFFTAKLALFFEDGRVQEKLAVFLDLTVPKPLGQERSSAEKLRPREDAKVS